MTMTNDNDTLSKGVQCQSDSWPYGHSDGVMPVSLLRYWQEKILLHC